MALIYVLIFSTILALIILRPARTPKPARMNVDPWEFDEVDEDFQQPFQTAIVGESYYKKNFRKLFGDPNADGVDVKTTAALILDDNNPHDPKAVRIEIDDRVVGHLSRDDARRFRELHSDSITCPARVRGGWVKNGKWNDYGVTLDVALD